MSDSLVGKFWKNTIIISLLLEISFAWILVKLFGNHYEGESIWGDVFLFITIFWGLQILIGFKDLLFWYINFRIHRNEFLIAEVEFLKQNKFPHPNSSWDLENPDFYYQDAMNNEELPVEVRILAAQKYAITIDKQGFGKLIRAMVLHNLNKESISKYKGYCEMEE